MILKFRVEEAAAESEFGMACQRLVPWAATTEEPPFGVMACFLPPAGKSDPDCHDQDEVMIIVAGHGTVSIAGDSDTVTTGDFVFIPRNREHVVTNPHAETLTWISCYWPLHEAAPRTGSSA